MNKSIFIGLIAILIAQFTTAQNASPIKDIAVAGKGGIWLNIGKQPLNIRNSSKEIVAIKVEKKINNEAFKSLDVNLNPPQNLVELTEKFNFFDNKLPVSTKIDNKTLTKIWDKWTKYGVVDSIKQYISNPALRQAFGLIVVDEKVQAGNSYTYKISYLNERQTIIKTMISENISLPIRTKPTSLAYESNISEVNKVQILFSLNSATKPFFFKTYRRDNPDSEFTEIQANYVSYSYKSKPTLLMIDQNIQPLRSYSYVVEPFDYYGNPSAKTEAITVGTYNYQNEKIPYDIKAVNLSTENAIKLNWKISNPNIFKSVQIWRSEQFDKEFKMIKENLPIETEFIDKEVLPMQKYYYYLVSTGLLNEISGQTAKVFSLFEDHTSVLAVGGIFALPHSKGIQLKWQTGEPNIKGYHIYRSNFENNKFEIINSLVPHNNNNEIQEFVDSTQIINANTQYKYYIISENTSHMRSVPSDTVLGESGKKASINPPLGFEANYEAPIVKLKWNNLSESEARDIKGVDIFRKKTNDINFLKINNAPIDVNYFEDSLINISQSYDYQLKTVGYHEETSKATTSKTVVIPKQQLPTPKGLMAIRTSNGIVLQWDEVKSALLKEIKIYRYQRNEKAKLLQTQNINELSFTDNTIKNGLYFYYLTCIDKANNESNASEEIAIEL